MLLLIALHFARQKGAQRGGGGKTFPCHFARLHRDAEAVFDVQQQLHHCHAIKAKREEITHQALEEARRAEERFRARVGELHATFVEKARGRAEQTIAELQRRYDERSKELRQGAEAREADAVDAALGLLLKGIRG